MLEMAMMLAQEVPNYGNIGIGIGMGLAILGAGLGIGRIAGHETDADDRAARRVHRGHR